MKNKIIIYILSFNRPAYLLEAIKSIESLNIQVDNIVVLDNGSSPDLMTNCKVELQNRVVWISAITNRGFGWNFARAFENLDSEYVMALHDDDRLVSNILDFQLRYLDTNPDVIAIGCNGYRIDNLSRRDGKLVLPRLSKPMFIHFNNSAQIGLHHYSASCIPFSPIIYRASSVRVIALDMKLIENMFGQSLDVAFLMFLADVGIVALNTLPLYECRVHSGQDSVVISDQWRKKLMEFTFNHVKGNDFEIKSLRHLIRKWYTSTLFIDITKHVLFFRIRNIFNLILHIDTRFLSFSGISEYFIRLTSYLFRSS